MSEDTQEDLRDAGDLRNLKIGRMASVRINAFQGQLQMKRGSRYYLWRDKILIDIIKLVTIRWRERFLILHGHTIHIYKNESRTVFKFKVISYQYR